MKIKILIIVMFIFAALLLAACGVQRSKVSKGEEKFLTSIPTVTISPTPVPTDLPEETVEPTSNTEDGDGEYNNDYDKYIGKWFASQTAINYDSTWSEGGFILEITEIEDSYVKGYYANIQAPPANRIADFNFEGNIKDNKLTFNFEDGFLNTGNATIEFKDISIEVKINDLEISEDNPSGWCASDAIFSIERRSK